MDKEIVVDNEFGTMWFYPGKKIIAHQIKKFIYGESLYNFLLAGTEMMRKNKAHKWLSDDRYSPVLRKEDMEWGVTNWFPQTVQAGWKYWAIVQPIKTVGQMNMEELVKNYSKAGVIAKFFTDPDEALKWLDKQKV
jgi:hypothetical protein